MRSNYNGIIHIFWSTNKFGANIECLHVTKSKGKIMAKKKASDVTKPEVEQTMGEPNPIIPKESPENMAYSNEMEEPTTKVLLGDEYTNKDYKEFKEAGDRVVEKIDNRTANKYGEGDHGPHGCLVKNTEEAKANTPDLETVGNCDSFKLLFKAGSRSQGWIKSTKALPIPGRGVVLQVTTQQRNKDGSISMVAEALTFVPGAKVVEDINGGNRLA